MPKLPIYKDLRKFSINSGIKYGKKKAYIQEYNINHKKPAPKPQNPENVNILKNVNPTIKSNLGVKNIKKFVELDGTF